MSLNITIKWKGGQVTAYICCIVKQLFSSIFHLFVWPLWSSSHVPYPPTLPPTPKENQTGIQHGQINIKSFITFGYQEYQENLNILLYWAPQGVLWFSLVAVKDKILEIIFYSAGTGIWALVGCFADTVLNPGLNTKHPSFQMVETFGLGAFFMSSTIILKAYMCLDTRN